MRGLFLAGLTAALLLAPVAAPTSGQATPRRHATCVKIRHSKTVWVKVKRNGQVVRVKRRKVWWACDPYAAPGPPRIGIVAKEFKLTFTRPYVKAGNLILQFDNQGEDVHNLRIGPGRGGPAFARIANTRPRQQTTVEVPLRPGRYRLWCSLPRHAKLGMKAVLKVARPG